MNSFRRIGIMGLGLIGGSLAKALKKSLPGVYITGWGPREASLKKAYADGAIDRYTLSLGPEIADCDVLFVCTPIQAIPAYLEELHPLLSPSCIVSDVGSTKASVYDYALRCPGLCFIGGHPMAGSEKKGYDAAVAHLFENAYYILTPLPTVPADTVERFTRLVQSIGAIPVVLQPSAHDGAVAAISHAPHVIAAALTNTVHQLDGPQGLMHTLAAGGFKDITRIASSDPDMWSGICLDNRKEVAAFLEAFQDNLRIFAQALQAENGTAVARAFQEAKTYRDSFINKASYVRNYEIHLDIEDRPGVIATVATILSFNGINIKNIGIVNSRAYEGGALQIMLDSEENRQKSLALLEGMGFTVYG